MAAETAIPLTDKQLAVAQLAADGYTITEIAEQVGCAPRTAKCHLDVVRRKLGVEHKREIGRALRVLGVAA